MPNKNAVKDSKLFSIIESWHQDYKLLLEEKSKSPAATTSTPTQSAPADSEADAKSSIKMDVAAEKIESASSEPTATEESKPAELSANDSPSIVKAEPLSAPLTETGTAAAASTAATGDRCAPSGESKPESSSAEAAAPAPGSGPSGSGSGGVAPANAEDIRVYVNNIGEVCEQLLAAWSSLREVFRIPRRQQAEQRKEAEKQLDDWTEAQSTRALLVLRSTRDCLQVMNNYSSNLRVESKPQPSRPAASRMVSAPSGFPKYSSAAAVASVPLDPKAAAEREQLKQLRRRAFEEQVRAEQEEQRRRTEYHRLVEEQMKAHQQLQAVDAYYFTGD